MRITTRWLTEKPEDTRLTDRTLEKLAEEVAARVGLAPPRTARLALHATFEEIESDPDAATRLWHIALSLGLPGAVLSADADAETPVDALTAARDTLLANLEAHVAGAGERAPARRRPRTDLQDVRPRLGAYREKGRRRLFLERLGPYLGPLRRQARHALRLHQATGDLPEGELVPADLVDEVAAWAFDRWDELAEREDLEVALAERLEHALAREIEAVNHESVHLESDTPPDAEKYLEESDEQLSYLEHDETLGWEDVLADEHLDPRQILEGEELSGRALEAVRALPRLQRDIFIYSALAGYTDAQVASLVDEDVGRVRRDLQEVRRTLQERLA